MKKNITEIVFILDRSGPMSGLEADTIGVFNSMIEKQKRAEDRGRVWGRRLHCPSRCHRLGDSSH